MRELGNLGKLFNYYLTISINHLSEGGLVISLPLFVFSLGVIEGDIHSHFFSKETLTKLGHFLSSFSIFALRGNPKGNSPRKPFLEGLELEDRS